MKFPRVKCWYCDSDAEPMRLTCTSLGCDETMARAEAHSNRRGHVVRGGRPRAREEQEAIELAADDALARSVCGASNAHLSIRCGRRPNHEGLHAAGRLKWQGGERPRYFEDGDDEAFSDTAPPSDADRLASLTEVLVTARAQMLGLGTGLRKALDEMPRSVDRRAVQGLVGALGHIVQHLDRHVIHEGETALRKGLRLGADALTAAEFDVPPGVVPPPPPPPLQVSLGEPEPVRRPIGEFAATRSKLLEAMGGPEVMGDARAVVDHFREKVDRLQKRIEELEAAPPVPEQCRGFVLEVRRDRARFNLVEKAVLVAAIRGLWGGPKVGGDWVDRALETAMEKQVRDAQVDLVRLGYLTDQRATLAGVRLAVMVMDQEKWTGKP